MELFSKRADVNTLFLLRCLFCKWEMCDSASGAFIFKYREFVAARPVRCIYGAVKDAWFGLAC